LEYGLLTETEFYQFIKEDFQTYEVPSILTMMNMNYTFNTAPISAYGAENPNDIKSKINTDISPENIYDLVKNMNFDNIAVPTRESMKKLLNKVPTTNIKRSNEEIEKEYDQLEKRNAVINSNETNEDKERKYIESGDTQSMLAYLTKEANKRGINLNSQFQQIMISLMMVQIWISMFDPTQVLTDIMLEKLLNQGVLADFIDREKNKDSELVMNLTFYPSSLVAKLMYENLVDLMRRQGISRTKENIINKLSNLTADEKWEIEYASLMLGKLVVDTIKNPNPIRYSGNPNVSFKSQIQPIEFTKAELVVQPGGNGLIEIRKN
jgi:hypothetical protein